MVTTKLIVFGIIIDSKSTTTEDIFITVIRQLIDSFNFNYTSFIIIIIIITFITIIILVINIIFIIVISIMSIRFIK